MALNPKQKRFCEEYIKDCNATKAAIRAGYSQKTVYANVTRMMENDGVALYISELQAKMSKKTEITAERILNALGDIGFGGDDVRQNDRIKALELLGKNHKLFTDKHEHAVTSLPPIEVTFTE